MAFPVAKSYSAASGATMYCGRSASTPAWMATAGVALNKLVLMPGAGGAGGAAQLPWGGWAVDLANNYIFYMAQGGHTDSADNRVVRLRAGMDTLAWDTLMANSGVYGQNINVPYQPDGSGTSTHSYDYVHYIPQVGRIMKHGLKGLHKDGGDAWVIQGFNPNSTPPAWDPAGTFTYGIGNGYAGCSFDHIHGNVLLQPYIQFYRPATNDYSPLYTTSVIPYRYPVAYSTAGDFHFCLQWNDGLSGVLVASAVLNASKITTAGVQTAITFNASAAYTQFLADKVHVATGNVVGYCGMCYDSINGCFYWYCGYAGYENRIYKIIPNGGTAWDMQILPLDTSMASMPTAVDAGINGRIKYFPLLKGFVISPTGNEMYFVKTSA